MPHFRRPITRWQVAQKTQERAGRARPLQLGPTARIEEREERTHPMQNSHRATQVGEDDRTLGRLLDWLDQPHYICSLEER